MMKRETFEIARIYVPVKRRASLEPDKVAALAQSILNEGLKTRSGCGRTASAA